MLEIIIAFVKAVGIVLLLSCPIVMWACLVVSGRTDDDADVPNAQAWLYAGLYRQGDRIFSFQRSKRDRMRGTAIGKQREG